MSAIIVSQHAAVRMRQRGVRLADVELVLGCASAIGDDVLFLSSKDADREISRRKREIEALQRLRGQKLVVVDDTIVTCYRSCRRDQKRLLRNAR